MGESGSGVPVTGEPPVWPPVISAAALPRHVVWRDLAITALLWGGFVAAIIANRDVAWHAIGILVAPEAAEADPFLASFLARMGRRFGLAFILVSVLAGATVVSIRRRRRALRRPAPPPAQDADLAQALGLTLDQLEAARMRKCLTVATDSAGRVAWPPAEDAAS